MKKLTIDKKIIEFQNKKELIYLVIYPEMASETNFDGFFEHFIEIFEKKYLRNLEKKE